MSNTNNDDAAVSVWSGDRKRERGGRFAVEERCEFCGKPITVATGGHFSDDEVLNAPDSTGLGLLLCGRVRCSNKRDALTTAERRDAYAAGRARNDAAK